MKRKILVLLMLGICSLPSLAQDFLGYRQSNYSGVSGGDLNPAHIADNRFKVDVTLFGMSTSAYNDHLYINPHIMPYWWNGSFSGDTIKNPKAAAWQETLSFDRLISSANAQDSVNANKGSLFEFGNPKGLNRQFFFETNIDILNAMVSISDKMAISIGVKNRTFLNIDNVSPELIALATNGLDFASLWNQNFTDETINLAFNNWTEYNLGFAMSVLDEGEHFLKAGVKVKFLQGLGSIYMYSDEMRYNVKNADTLYGLGGDFNYGYSANIDEVWDASSSSYTGGSGADSSLTFGDVRQMQSKLGLGFDIGVVYEWRPDWEEYKYDMDGETNIWRKDRNKYKVKFSLALNDIGGMRYEKSKNSRDFSVDVPFDDQNAVLSLFDFDDTEGLESFNANVDTLVQAGYASYDSEDEGSYYMNLPTHLTANIDYHVWSDIYVNAGAFVGFQMKNDAHKVRYPTTFSVTPRYDFAWAGLSIPVNYNTIYGATAGLGLRLGPVILGTSDLRTLFVREKDKKIRGANFYFALKVPILHSHPNDVDLDKVSDKLDACPDIAGVWAFKGCPDSDLDGIQDSEDECPNDPGTAEFNGCPDRDGDKVIDKNDDCPDDPGLVEFNGCPDRDGDKIIDKDDECPDVAGIELFKGCPDTDGDGLKDEDDLCPTVAGPIENQGCPDSDNDGIFDYLDSCPTEAGPVENRGCPWPDTDGDGLLDKDDKCPYNAGPAKNDGCPYKDTDGDGVLDKDDNCVNVPGTIENKGCPEIDEKDQIVINTAFENLEFESAKAVIKESSYESLTNLAILLVDKKDWKLKVSGHTDSQGAAQSNLILSKKRAEAVQQYLITNGVEAERILVEYFGEEKPIDTNDTPEGRQKNRRVEMDIQFE
ncbi:DUF5723 family protein [Crocinitomix catalasitica]|uniref:DUF5723 family protein n=1 Tax=Crocinitomix catalasitica TaxID=184607 RepID=UPI0006874402|nr:DUF5723 family protein [Crocinitomix catalasitica]